MRIENVDWPLLLQFLDIVIWPFITFIGLLMVRPLIRVLVKAFTTKGGKFSVAGFEAEINASASVEHAAQAVSSGPSDASTEQELETIRVQLREMEPAELYYKIMESWKEVSIELDIAYNKEKGVWLDWRSGKASISKAKKLGLLNAQQATAIDDLFKVRSSAKIRGPARFEDMEMDAEDVFNYVRATRALAKQISSVGL